MSELEVVAYDQDWPREFARERDRLRAALPDLLVDVEHIGSTAVPGLAAKPVIDIMASVATLEQARAAIDRIEALGYRYTDVILELVNEARAAAGLPPLDDIWEGERPT